MFDRDSLIELTDLLEDENNADLRDNLILALFPGGLSVEVNSGDSYYRSEDATICKVRVELGPLSDYDSHDLS